MTRQSPFTMPTRFSRRAETSAGGNCILFICTGNICRSAFGHHYLAKRLESAAPGRFDVSSAGTGVNQSLRVPGEILGNSAAADLDSLREHAPRLAHEPLVRAADLILTATARHSDTVIDQTPAAHRKTFTVLQFADLLAELPEERSLTDLVAQAHALRRRRGAGQTRELDIPDPFGGDAAGYDAMVTQLTPALDAIAEALLTLPPER